MPKNGKIKINGEIVNNYPIFQRTKKFNIGYVPQYGGFFGDLSLYNNLKAIGEITINNKILIEERINYLISKFELENIKDIKAKFLSGGQKKKISNCFSTSKQSEGASSGWMFCCSWYFNY